MRKLRVLDLFSGIGGFSLGLERTGGFETVAFCEIEPFPRKVLAKHWPEVPRYEDVRTLTADRLAADGITGIDVITGGFPCQDISVAGKLAGIGEGTRSGLWSEIVRLTRELRPRYVIVENVANLLSGPSERPGGWFGRVLGDLAECGYDAEWENIPASALGAPHRRERIWIVGRASVGWDETALADSRRSRVHERRFLADAEGESDIPRGMERDGVSERSWRQGEALADADKINEQGKQPSIVDKAEWQGSLTGQAGSRHAIIGGIWSAEPDVGRVAHGVPDRMDRLKGLGNAVVPQIPELIGNAILEAEGMKERAAA